MSPLLLLFLLAQAAPATPAASPSPAAEATPKPPPSGPVVILDTSLGRIKIGLHKDKAPISVDNFIKYVHGGHYDGTIFHRVMPGFMIQGGGFDPGMEERPTRPPIKNEAKNGLRNSRGTVAMARTSDPNSATAQFFISVKDNHRLDFGIGGAGYAVFGEVLEGMDVVDKIVAVSTTEKGQHQSVPITPVLIKTAREAGTPARAPAPAKSPSGSKPSASPSPSKPSARPSPPPARVPDDLDVEMLPVALYMQKPAETPLDWVAPAEERGRKNPEPGSPEAIKKGGLLYRQHCALCHGEQGKGDGPAARLHAQRAKPPEDLTKAAVQGRLTDGEIFWKISNGLRRGDQVIMPAVPGVAEDDRWKIVHFIRSLVARSQPGA